MKREKGDTEKRGHHTYFPGEIGMVSPFFEIGVPFFSNLSYLYWPGRIAYFFTL